MEINTEINSSLDSLNEYNKIYPWIPNEHQIRPTELIIKFKKILFDKIFNEYKSSRDYILINLFNYKIKRENEKLVAIESLESFHKFDVCRFRYQIDSSAFHYIMWYTCPKETLTIQKITNDIKSEIYNIIKSDNFKFVYYENPKMTISDIYHVQVFWMKE